MAFGGNLDYMSGAGYLGSELFSFMVPLLLLIAAIGAGARGDRRRGGARHVRPPAGEPAVAPPPRRRKARRSRQRDRRARHRALAVVARRRRDRGDGRLGRPSGRGDDERRPACVGSRRDRTPGRRRERSPRGRNRRRRRRRRSRLPVPTRLRRWSTSSSQSGGRRPSTTTSPRSRCATAWRSTTSPYSTSGALSVVRRSTQRGATDALARLSLQTRWRRVDRRMFVAAAIQDRHSPLPEVARGSRRLPTPVRPRIWRANWPAISLSG